MHPFGEGVQTLSQWLRSIYGGSGWSPGSGASSWEEGWRSVEELLLELVNITQCSHKSIMQLDLQNTKSKKKKKKN